MMMTVSLLHVKSRMKQIIEKKEAHTEEQKVPFNPKRTTLPHRRPQRLGQNIYDAGGCALF